MMPKRDRANEPSSRLVFCYYCSKDAPKVPLNTLERHTERHHGPLKLFPARTRDTKNVSKMLSVLNKFLLPSLPNDSVAPRRICLREVSPFPEIFASEAPAVQNFSLPSGSGGPEIFAPERLRRSREKSQFSTRFLHLEILRSKDFKFITNETHSQSNLRKWILYL